MKRREREVVDNENLADSIKWSSICDLENKLILYYTHLVTKVQVDKTILDPDGVPLVLVDYQRVTRVRKMTDEEYEQFTKERKQLETSEAIETIKDINLEFRVAEVPEKKEKGKT